jgi:hypothetical protein
MVQERPEHKLIGFVTETTPVDPAADETCRRCSAIMAAFIASRYRSSSRAEDDFLCFASLLGWGTTPLSNVPIGNRMQTLLENQSTLPQGLLFISGPRMEESGWRWAVKNFGNSGARPLDARIDDTTLGTRTPRGSVVRYPGLILQLPPSTLEGSAFVVEASGSGGNNSFFKNYQARRSLPRIGWGEAQTIPGQY